MKFSHRFLILASLGFGLGIIVGTLITAATATMTYADGTLYLCSRQLIEDVGNPLLAFTIQCFATGIYGAIAMGGSAVYSIEEWSIARCTVTHFFSTIVCLYILGFFMRWFTLEDFSSLLTMFVIFVIPYIIIWMVNYLSCRKELRKINRELEILKSSEKKSA